MSVEFQVDVAPGPYARGDQVTGTVLVLEGGRSRELLVSLRYREQSPDHSFTAVEVPGGVLHTGDLTTGQRFEFSIPMPSDALPEQRLRHGELWWEIDVKCDKPGADAHATVRLPSGPKDEEEDEVEAAASAAAPTDRGGTPLLNPSWAAATSSSTGSGATRSGSARSRSGSLVGTIVAIVLVVGGIGVGVALGLSDDSGGDSSATPAPRVPAAPSAIDEYTRCLVFATSPRESDHCHREFGRSVGGQPDDSLEVP